jgi:hypothetical protein
MLLALVLPLLSALVLLKASLLGLHPVLAQQLQWADQRRRWLGLQPGSGLRPPLPHRWRQRPAYPLDRARAVQQLLVLVLGLVAPQALVPLPLSALVFLKVSLLVQQLALVRQAQLVEQQLPQPVPPLVLEPRMAPMVR